jgi:hypothetical protein
MVARVARRHLLLIALIILTSCTGALTPADPLETGSAPGAVALLLSGGLPPLPEGREASTARVSEVNGNEADFHSVNAIEDGTVLDLISQSNAFSWGVWEFNPWLESLTSIQVVMSIPDGEEAWIALSNYSKGTWDFEGPLTAGKSVVLDNAKHRSSAGNLYVAVLTHGGDEVTVHKLVLTTEDGWVIVTVDDSYNVGRYTSLAVINGMPAISYCDMYHVDLKYAGSATATGGNAAAWSLATVDSAGYVGEHTSLAEVEGQPAISYLDDTNDALKYARRVSEQPEAWTAVTVHTSDIGEDVGYYTSLADVNGYPLITYYDAGEGYLRYAWSNTTTGMDALDWQTSVLDNTEDCDIGQYNSLAVVDSKAAVSYGVKYTISSLMYKWFSNAAKVKVDTPLGEALYTSLAVVNSKPAISWYDSGYGTLHYSYSSTTRGTSNTDWSTIVIPNPGDAGRYSSLAVIGGRPAIAYVVTTTFPSETRLMFAWSSTAAGWNVEDWNATTVDDSSPLLGEFSSLAEVDGKPAISYFDGDNHCLKYAIHMGP